MQDDYVSSYWTFYDRVGHIIQANQAQFCSQFYSFLNVFWFFRYNIWAFLRSRWPRALRCRSAAARLLGFRVRIPSAAWVSLVSVVYGLEGSATGRSLVWGSPTECGVSGCDLKTQTVRRPSSRGLSSYKNLLNFMLLWWNFKQIELFLTATARHRIYFPKAALGLAPILLCDSCT